MKKILTMLIMALLLVPAIAVAQTTGTGTVGVSKGLNIAPLTLVAGSNIMEYRITTQNTGQLPFYGRTLIVLSGKKVFSTGYEAPIAIPGRSSDCWTLEYTDPEYSTTESICGGQGAGLYEIETPPFEYGIGSTKVATLKITAPIAFSPAIQELTLVTLFEDFSTGIFMSFQVDQIETTTANGKITLEFIQIILTLGGLAAILGPLGIAFI